MVMATMADDEVEEQEDKMGEDQAGNLNRKGKEQQLTGRRDLEGETDW